MGLKRGKLSSESPTDFKTLKSQLLINLINLKATKILC